MLLTAKGIIKRFGGLTAVQNVDFEIEPRSISAIIGPNGAGKTTFFNIMTGIYKPEEGDVVFDQKSIVGLRPDQVNAAGIARTFQNIRLFGNLSVVENVLVGMHSRLKLNVLATIMHSAGFRVQERDALKQAAELLDFVGLREKANEIAKNLPYGDQRRLEIARALASRPKLILLDEPTAGMNPQESLEAMHLFRQIRDERGVTVLMIEHDMRVVMGISERITVLDYGQKIAEGTPEQVRMEQRVIEAYLGRGAAGGVHA
jgi:branched-chain amino acid transport system ATP-binding protein